MAGGGQAEGGRRKPERPAPRAERRVIYCIVPADLAGKLHEPLREHFGDRPDVDVVVERRSRERRADADRRTAAAADAPAPSEDRRQVRSPAGRRVADRRATTRPIEAPPLPRKARPHAARIAFLERAEPGGLAAEDADTDRLINRVQAGEKELFGTVYTRYFDRVFGYLRTALDDPQEAEDIAQQVFVRILESLPTYERRESFRFWMFAIVRNLAIDELRRRSRVTVEDPEEVARMSDEAQITGDDLPIIDWISDRDLSMFLDRLPQPQQQVLILRLAIGLGNDQIAEMMGRTEADVRKLQHRALKFLRDRLTAIGRDPGYEPRRNLTTQPQRSTVLRARRFPL